VGREDHTIKTIKTEKLDSLVSGLMAVSRLISLNIAIFHHRVLNRSSFWRFFRAQIADCRIGKWQNAQVTHQFFTLSSTLHLQLSLKTSSWE